MSVKYNLRDLTVGLFCRLFSFSSEKAVVLLYHSINPKPHWLSVAPELFEEQIASLKEQGYKFLSLQDLQDVSRFVDQKVAMITFDDGLEDNFIHAVPVLRKYGVPAVFFVSTDFVGKKKPRKDFRCMSWDQIKSLSNDPLFEIGSHALSHKKFVELTEEEAAKEITESKKILENELGVDVDSFAFPYGLYRKEHIEMLERAGYKYSFSCERRRLHKKVSLLEIPRYVVDPVSSPSFKYMSYFGYEFYWKIYYGIYRKLFNRL